MIPKELIDSTIGLIDNPDKLSDGEVNTLGVFSVASAGNIYCVVLQALKLTVMGNCKVIVNLVTFSEEDDYPTTFTVSREDLVSIREDSNYLVSMVLCLLQQRDAYVQTFGRMKETSLAMLENDLKKAKENCDRMGESEFVYGNSIVGDEYIKREDEDKDEESSFDAPNRRHLLN